MNISSVIVHTRPDAAAPVRSRLARLGGVEVHATSDAGKMIVTIESADVGAAVKMHEAIERIDGVLSVTMVFQQTEAEPDKSV